MWVLLRGFPAATDKYQRAGHEVLLSPFFYFTKEVIKILLAEAVVEIRGNMSPLQTKFRQVKGEVNKGVSTLQKSMDKWGDSIKRVGMVMAGAGVAFAGALTACIAKTVSFGDALDKMSKRTGVSVEALSGLKYAAEISGSSLKSVEQSLRFLARSMDDTSQGIGEAKEKFELLNIAVTDAQGNLRPVVDVMKEAADKIAAMTNETEKVSIATDLFGSRFGTQLLPLLKEGRVGIEKLTDKAADLGLVISTEAAAAAAEFNDRLTDLKSSLGAAAMQIGNALLPVLQPLVEQMTQIISKVAKWIEVHPKLTKEISKAALVMSGLMATGGPLLMLAPTAISITTALKRFVPALTATGGAAAGATPGVAGFGVAIKGLAASLATVSAYLAAVGSVLWAGGRIYRAFKEPIDVAKISIRELSKAIRVQEDALYALGTALQGYESAGFERATATLGDLDINLKAVNKALGINLRESQNAVDVIQMIDRGWSNNILILRRARGEIDQLTEAQAGAGDETQDVTDHLENFARAMGIVTDQISDYEKAVKVFGEAQEAAAKQFGLPSPSTEELLRPLSAANAKLRETRKLIRGQFDIVPKVAWQAASETKAALGAIADEYFKLTHTEKELLDKQWEAEEERLIGLRVGEEALQKAKYSFYKEYNDKVQKLEKQRVEQAEKDREKALDEWRAAMTQSWEGEIDLAEAKADELLDIQSRGYEAQQQQAKEREKAFQSLLGLADREITKNLDIAGSYEDKAGFIEAVYQDLLKVYEQYNQDTAALDAWRLGKLEALTRAEEKLRTGLLARLTAAEVAYYDMLSGELQDYASMTSEELEEVKAAWLTAGDSISTGWRAAMVEITARTRDWAETFISLSDSIERSISGLFQGLINEERRQRQLLSTLSDEAKAYYRSLTGDTKSFKKMSSAELEKVHEAWDKFGSRIKKAHRKDMGEIMRRGQEWAKTFRDDIAETQTQWEIFCESFKQSFIKAIADITAEESVQAFWRGIKKGYQEIRGKPAQGRPTPETYGYRPVGEAQGIEIPIAQRPIGEPAGKREEEDEDSGKGGKALAILSGVAMAALVVEDMMSDVGTLAEHMKADWIQLAMLEKWREQGGWLGPKQAKKIAEDVIEGRWTPRQLGEIPKAQMGGIFTKPTIASIAEKKPEAVIPLRGGAVPVRIEGRALGTTLHIDNISVQASFPNVDLENMDAARFGRIMTKKINQGIREACRRGEFNEILIR